MGSFKNFVSQKGEGGGMESLVFFFLLSNVENGLRGGGTVKCKHNPHYSEKHENSILNVGDLTLTFILRWNAHMGKLCTIKSAAR